MTKLGSSRPWAKLPGELTSKRRLSSLFTLFTLKVDFTPLCKVFYKVLRNKL